MLGADDGERAKRPLVPGRGRVRGRQKDDGHVPKRSAVVAAIESIEPDFALSNASVVAEVLYNATGSMAPREIGDVVLGPGHDIVSIRNFMNRALNRLRSREGVISSLKDRLSVTMSQAFKARVSAALATLAEADPVSEAPATEARATETLTFFAVDVATADLGRAVEVRREALALGRDGDVQASREFRKAEGRPSWERQVHEHAFAAGRDGTVTREEEEMLSCYADMASEPPKVDQGADVPPLSSADASHVGGPTPLDATVGDVAPSTIAAEPAPLPEDTQDDGTDMLTQADDTKAPMVATGLMDLTEDAAEPLHAGLTLAAETVPAAVVGDLSTAEAIEVRARVASVRASLQTLADRKRRESRARVDAAVLDGIADMLREMAAQGVPMDEVRQAVEDGGFSLPDGFDAA